MRRLAIRAAIPGFILLLLTGCAVPSRSGADCSAAFSMDTFLDAVNRLRAREDVDALRVDAALNDQASRWAIHNATQNRRTHYDAEGRGPLERLKAAGVQRRTVAENIAMALPSMQAESIFRLWNGRPEGGNIMNPLYRRADYAMARAGDGCVIVLLLTE